VILSFVVENEKKNFNHLSSFCQFIKIDFDDMIPQFQKYSLKDAALRRKRQMAKLGDFSLFSIIFISIFDFFKILM